MDSRYADRVALLVAILPHLAREPDFALKGGTAINLFEHDLPRLSVDIDLGWLRTQSFEEDATLIREALGRLASTLAKPPLKLDVVLSRPPRGGHAAPDNRQPTGRTGADRDLTRHARHRPPDAHHGAAAIYRKAVRLCEHTGVPFR